MNDLRATASTDPDSITTTRVGSVDSPAGGPILYVFSTNPADNHLAVSLQDDLQLEVESYLRQGIALLTKEALPDSGFVIEQATLNDEQHTFVVSWTEDSSLLFGIEVDRQWLRGVLQQTFDDNVLLPESLAGGAVTNDANLAQSLVIGGLPKSRLPVIVAVILLAAGLLVAAMRQLQRENAVMQRIRPSK